MTNVTAAYRMGNVLIALLLALFLSACTSTSITNSPSSSTATPAPTATVTPSPTPGLTFQHFNNASFTLEYPAGWQTSTHSIFSDRPIYSFTDPNRKDASFHVELHAIYFDADSPIRDLFGDQMDTGTNCDPSSASLPPSLSINGITWNQAEIVCKVGGATYEIRFYTHTDSTNHGPVIAYGAYQTPSFASLVKSIFEPMLTSFKAK